MSVAGKRSSSPSYAAATRNQPSKDEGGLHLVEKKKRRKRKQSGIRRVMRGKSRKCAGDTTRKKIRRSVPRRSPGLEVLSIQRARKEEVLLVLKKALVSKRSLEISHLDETVKEEEVVAVLAR